MRTNAKRPKKQAKKKTLERLPGGVSIGPASHPRYPWVVRWPGEGGRRMVRWFLIETDALEWAKEKSAESGDNGEQFGTLGEDERMAVSIFRDFCRIHTAPAPPSLSEVVKDFTERWKATLVGAEVGAAVEKFIEDKTSEGRSRGHLETASTRLRKFATAFAGRTLPSFTTPEISQYLSNLRGPVLAPAKPRPEGARKLKDRPPSMRKTALLSLTTRAGHRASLHSLFEWAVRHDMIETNPVSKAVRPTPRPKVPGTLNAEQVAAYFAALELRSPSLVPFWAVRVFAGLREAEAVRADWRMVNLVAGKITLPPTITKTGKPRAVRIEPALAAFLQSHARKSGPICPLSPMARRWHLRLVMRDLPGVSLPRNWARHTYATNHLHAFQNSGNTALLLGHRGAPDVLFNHYEGVGSEEDAAAFWAIRPGTPENVVEMEETGGVEILVEKEAANA